jgi:hypothetical protein
MVLNVCAELFYRTSFELIGFFIRNWFAVLVTLAIVSFITNKLGPVILGFLASGLNFIGDTSIVASLGFTSILTILISIAIGIIWTGFVFYSAAPFILKLINIIPMFLLGFMWGLIPIPIPIAIFLGFSLNWRITNYLMAVIPILIIIVLIFLVGPESCNLINEGIKFAF